MWELDCEGWALKNWCFWTVVLEKPPESPLDCKEIQPVHSKGDQPWVFFGRNDAKAETPVLWPPHAKNWLIGKDSDAGRDWGQEEKGTTEDEMAGWHNRLNGHEFEWTLGAGDGQGGLTCWFMGLQRVGHDWATELNWAECTQYILLWKLVKMVYFILYIFCHNFKNLIVYMENKWGKDNGRDRGVLPEFSYQNHHSLCVCQDTSHSLSLCNCNVTSFIFWLDPMGTSVGKHDGMSQ